MKIQQIKDYTEITHARDSVLVLGYFDGLHLGHKALFEQARKIAISRQLSLSVLTFNESPRLALNRFTPNLLLNLQSPKQRYDKFATYGVDCLYLMNFTSQFARLSSEQFLTHYIQRLKAKVIVVGFDYQFGYDRQDVNQLRKQFSGEVVVVPAVQHDGEKIGSTRIRQLVLKGDIQKANVLLGYPFSIRGIVVHGDGRGRTIGFPTANLAPIDRVLLPSEGVYISDVIVKGNCYRSMTSIGNNVTFGGHEQRLESHILNFKDDIYGETIEIIFLDKIRDMLKFENVNKLIEQLQQDRKVATNWKKDS